MSEGSYMGDNPFDGFPTIPHYSLKRVKTKKIPDSADEIPIFLILRLLE